MPCSALSEPPAHVGLYVLAPPICLSVRALCDSVLIPHLPLLSLRHRA